MFWGNVNLAIFMPVTGMLMVFLLNHVAAARRASQQTMRDTRGLRAALLAELVLLRGLIAENLALIGRQEEYLLSFRVLTQVYRSNVGRLTLLPEPAIDAIVSAYGATEAAEVFLGATTRPHGGNAYRGWLGDSGFAEIAPRLHAARAAVDAAIAQLERAGKHPLLLTNFRHVQPDPAARKPAAAAIFGQAADAEA